MIRKLILSVFIAMSLINVALADERQKRLERLMAKFDEVHHEAELLRQQGQTLSAKLEKVRRDGDEITREIDQHQRQIEQARRKQQANNRDNQPNKGKKQANNRRVDQQADRRLEQQIREEQQKVANLKQRLRPLQEESDKLKGEHKNLEQELRQKITFLWAWRNDWVAAADIDFSAAPEQHEAFLSTHHFADGSGPQVRAWRLARAIAEIGTGRYDEALASLEPLKTDDAWKAKVASLRAFVYAQQGNEAKSNNEFVRAVKLDNQDVHYYLLRAIIEVQQGKHAAAKRLLEAAEKLDRENKAVRRWQVLAVALHEKPSARDRKEALQTAEKLVSDTERRDWCALDALATVHAAVGDFALAEAVQRQAAAVAPGSHQSICEARAKDYALGRRPTYFAK